MTSRDARVFLRNPCRKPLSYRDLQHAITCCDLSRSDIHGQTPLDSFVKVAKQLLKCIALRGATWNPRDFRPITAFFCFVNYNFEFHDLDYTLAQASLASNHHLVRL